MTERVFGAKALEEYKWLLTRYPTKQAALLPALRLAEQEFGALGEPELKCVADLMQIPPARVYGVFTFYTHFRRAGTGKHHLQVCSTLSCALRGADALCDHLRKKLDIDVGETTEDGLFTLSKVECLASCDTAPVIQIDDDYHENLSIAEVDRIIARLRADARGAAAGVPASAPVSASPPTPPPAPRPPNKPGRNGR